MGIMQSHLKPLLKQINECTPYFSINNFDDRTWCIKQSFCRYNSTSKTDTVQENYVDVNNIKM